MRRPTVFTVRYEDLAELTGQSVEQLRQELGELSNHTLASVLNFTALNAKSDVKVEIVVYACAREKTQVRKWRQGRVRSHNTEVVGHDSDLRYGYDDLVDLTGLEKMAIYQHKKNEVFDPRNLWSVLVELVSRFAQEDVKTGLVVRACANTKFPSFFTDAQTKVKRFLRASRKSEGQLKDSVPKDNRGS